MHSQSARLFQTRISGRQDKSATAPPNSQQTFSNLPAVFRQFASSLNSCWRNFPLPVSRCRKRITITLDPILGAHLNHVRPPLGIVGAVEDRAFPLLQWLRVCAFKDESFKPKRPRTYQNLSKHNRICQCWYVLVRSSTFLRGRRAVSHSAPVGQRLAAMCGVARDCRPGRVVRPPEAPCR